MTKYQVGISDNAVRDLTIYVEAENEAVAKKRARAIYDQGDADWIKAGGEIEIDPSQCSDPIVTHSTLVEQTL